VINAHHGIDQATLGRAIGLDKVTTSQLVRGLEERPMLTRGMPIIDAVSLKLTTAGIALLDTAEPCIEDAYQRLRSALTSSEYALLVTLLDTLNNRLESNARAPFRPL
jgi:DNA-binding MarR family transcriptional regulator